MRLPCLFTLIAALGSCTTESSSESPIEQPECRTSTQCSGAKPLCGKDGSCQALPIGHQLGVGDGTPASVAIVPIYQPDQPLEATDIGFHPTRPNELWVLRRAFESSKPCDEDNKTAAGCAALESTVAIVVNAGMPDVSWKVYKDPNAWHFMRRAPAFAFGANDTFASCAEARTANFLDDQVDYIGPTLWSSDPMKFTKQPLGGNGAHLDMLHGSPFSMGIAHDQANSYWVFNGKLGSLDRYDFKLDHGPGQEDHSDGEMRRYVQGQLTRAPGIPSHMAIEQSSRELYVADTGKARIIKLAMESGTPAGKATPNYDGLKVYQRIDGAMLEEVVPPGTLTAPSGLELHDDLVFVSDNATSRLYAFDLDGKLVRMLDTGMPPGTLAGLAFGPDGRLYFADKLKGWVYRIEPVL